MNIILHQPEIPQNAGNIGRTCAATGTALHLIEPLGFRLNDRQLARSGMDYWKDLCVARHVNFQAFTKQHPGARSLNLSNAVAVVLYEALRQQGFPKVL